MWPGSGTDLRESPGSAISTRHVSQTTNSLRSGVTRQLHPSWQKRTALSAQLGHTQDFTDTVTVHWRSVSALQTACGGLRLGCLHQAEVPGKPSAEVSQAEISVAAWG